MPILRKLASLNSERGTGQGHSMVNFARRASIVVVALIVVVLADGIAHAGPWSATLYAGISSDRRFSDITSGKVNVRGGMVGLAVDRDLFNLGWDVSVAAEGQLTEYSYGSGFTNFALGLGLRFHKFPWDNTSLGIYTGPSYSLSPPHIPVYYYASNYRMKRWLNYIGLEFAVAVPWDPDHWDVVFRTYHRSGAWGVYSINIDEGTTIGLGIRARF